MTSDFNKDLKKIDGRIWSIIKGKWLAHIPNYSFPGEVPSHELADVIDIANLYTKTKDNPGSYKDEVVGIRSEILREGVFFAHKAVHVCGTAIVHLNNGILSWGVSSAYQASFFSLRSILCLLGLTFPRVNNKSLMIDCFPEEEVLSKNKQKQGILPKQELKFCIFPDLTHIHYWEVFQRILRVGEIDILADNFKEFLINLDPRDFPLQRNNLHYINNYWIFTKDLFERVFDSDFGVKGDLINEINNDLNVSKNDFSLLVCYLLIKFNVDLIKDIGQLAGQINNEYLLIRKTLSEGIHDRLHFSINFD